MKIIYEEKRHENIVKTIEEITGVHRKKFLFKGDRTADSILIRGIYMYMCRTKLKWTLQKIAQSMKYTDHSTIINGVNKVNNWKDIPHMYSRELELLEVIEETYGQKYESLV